LPFAGSLVLALLPSSARNAAGLIAGAVALITSVLTLALYAPIQALGAIRTELPWLPSLGLNLLVRIDGLSWLFAVLITVIGFLVILYARYYMSPRDPVPRFFAFLLAFMGAMLGLVLSGNLIQLAFFWELTSLFSFLLIGYWNHIEAARSSARMALIVTAAGGLCLLIGVLLIGKVVGSYDLDVVLAAADAIKASPFYVPALLFILLGAFTKSAQFPFHFWLPHAMAAPTPVSAYLHSATMVKAGIFVLMRFWPVLAGTQEWYLIVCTAGLATFVVGAWAACFQHDLKGLLAYSTISHLGIITLLLGLGSPLGLVAAIFHTVNHAAFKASLFMAAGIIDHETGTRDMRRLSGLYAVMPITATLATVAAAAMAGVPLLNGFLSKEMFLAEALEGTTGTLLDSLLPVVATAALALSVLYSLRFVHKTFFGPAPAGLAKAPQEPPFWMRLPITVLVLACLLIGVLPAITVGPALDVAVRAVLGDRTPAYSLAIWHGLTQPLLLSLVALVAGTVGYYYLRQRLNRAEGAPGIRYFKGRRMFETVLSVVITQSRVLEKLLGTRRLQSQLRILVAIASLAALLPFVRYGYALGPNALTPIQPGFAAIWLMGAACAIGAAWQAKYHRLAALILMSGAGLASCISFVWLSAPDLALTQLLVETVTTVLLLLGLRWMPKRPAVQWPQGKMPRSVVARRGSDLALALFAGAGMTALSLAVMTFPIGHTMSRYFLENAYLQGGGRNVVNVILVDFRALDTLGEITVLAIVGLTVYALLRRFRPARESVVKPQQQVLQNAYDDRQETRALGDTLSDYLFVPRVVIEWLFPAIVVLALYLLIRGHDAPGGGFAAGITMSIGLVLQYMAAGTRSIEERLQIQPLRWMGFGLLLAMLTGLGAWIFNYPYLTTWFRYAEIPLIGKVPLASALLFDLGVFFLVVGSTTLVLIAIAHQSIRTPSSRAKGPPGAAEKGAG
jgi:multicomponent K+:H+ antiporter subunit A